MKNKIEIRWRIGAHKDSVLRMGNMYSFQSPEEAERVLLQFLDDPTLVFPKMTTEAIASLRNTPFRIERLHTSFTTEKEIIYEQQTIRESSN